MNIRHLFRAALILVVLVVCSRDAAAQVRRYQPRQPTLSPYLNLLRPEGALPNYYALVRPFEEQRRFEERVNTFERRQQFVNRELELQMGQPGGVLSTGTASRFLTDSRRGSQGGGAYLNSRRYFNQFDPGINRRQR